MVGGCKNTSEFAPLGPGSVMGSGLVEEVGAGVMIGGLELAG